MVGWKQRCPNERPVYFAISHATCVVMHGVAYELNIGPEWGISWIGDSHWEVGKSGLGLVPALSLFMPVRLRDQMFPKLPIHPTTTTESGHPGEFVQQKHVNETRRNYHFLVMNDHFGGTSVHCGQILQKNPGKGQTPLTAMPGFWEHLVPHPLPYLGYIVGALVTQAKQNMRKQFQKSYYSHR